MIENGRGNKKPTSEFLQGIREKGYNTIVAKRYSGDEYIVLEDNKGIILILLGCARVCTVVMAVLH